MGSEGAIRSTNNGVDAGLRISQGEAVNRPQWEPAAFALPEARSATVTCLVDMTDALEEGRFSIGIIEITHHITEACLAVARSHKEGNNLVSVLGVDRDIYVWRV